MTTPESDKPLVTVRAALVLTLGVLVGVGAGLLAGAAGRGLPESVLSGCAAAAAGLLLFHQLIAKDD
ncbi:hypothetical protein [Actinomadura litoris]|uniref:hypothetical protein n=1 Tax=Actinomadura litoris TaxID=2678616 RepID=UPI001FA6C495|nr:hypothetical protein [Actinomadura litoris]